MKFIFTIYILLATNLYASDTFKGVTLYPFAYVKHAKPTPRTNEGNMDYFAISKEFSKDKWTFDTGAGTFIDSYSLRSYKVFTNISHKDFSWRFFRPLLALEYFYKGDSYTTNEMHQLVYPSLKLQIGEEDGLVMNIQPVPKIGTLTNGFIAVAVGYKF